jgi:hypothetical protein
MGHAVLADGPQQHPDELTVTPAANDKEIRSLGCLYQQGSRMTFGDAPPDTHPGMCLTHRREQSREKRFGIAGRIKGGGEW